MVTAHDDSTTRLAARLAQMRRQRFVGRGAELELFRIILTADESRDESQIALLYIYGPGGVGKTSLLSQYAHLAQTLGRHCVVLDSRNFRAAPDSFERALRAALQLPDEQPLGEALVALPHLVLLIDTYEQIAALDTWLRDIFLPQLPQGALVVLAGRNPPDNAWRIDEGWRMLARFVPLANLPPDDCHRYLTIRGIPAEAQPGVLNFTHGHPLALSLVADLYQNGYVHRGAASLPALDERAVIQMLLERFLADAPSAQHRAALELCSIAFVTTEALLSAHFGEQVGYELFRWLCGLTLMEQGAQGIFPHDLVREVIGTDLLWRNPAAYENYQQTILTHLRTQLSKSQGHEQQRYSLEILFVNRQAPGMKQFFAWDNMDSVYAEPATADAFDAIVEMVRQHEGEESAAIVRHWQERQPKAFLAYRTNDGKLFGFMTQLALEQVTHEDMAVDPAMAMVFRYLETQQNAASSELCAHGFPTLRKLSLPALRHP